MDDVNEKRTFGDDDTTDTELDEKKSPAAGHADLKKHDKRQPSGGVASTNTKLFKEKDAAVSHADADLEMHHDLQDEEFRLDHEKQPFGSDASADIKLVGKKGAAVSHADIKKHHDLQDKLRAIGNKKYSDHTEDGKPMSRKQRRKLRQSQEKAAGGKTKKSKKTVHREEHVIGQVHEPFRTGHLHGFDEDEEEIDDNEPDYEERHQDKHAKHGLERHSETIQGAKRIIKKLNMDEVHELGQNQGGIGDGVGIDGNPVDEEELELEKEEAKELTNVGGENQDNKPATGHHEHGKHGHGHPGGIQGQSETIQGAKKILKRLNNEGGLTADMEGDQIHEEGHHEHDKHDKGHNHGHQQHHINEESTTTSTTTRHSTKILKKIHMNGGDNPGEDAFVPKASGSVGELENLEFNDAIHHIDDSPATLHSDEEFNDEEIEDEGKNTLFHVHTNVHDKHGQPHKDDHKNGLSRGPAHNFATHGPHAMRHGNVITDAKGILRRMGKNDVNQLEGSESMTELIGSQPIFAGDGMEPDTLHTGGDGLETTSTDDVELSSDHHVHNLGHLPNHMHNHHDGTNAISGAKKLLRRMNDTDGFNSFLENGASMDEHDPNHVHNHNLQKPNDKSTKNHMLQSSTAISDAKSILKRMDPNDLEGLEQNDGHMYGMDEPALGSTELPASDLSGGGALAHFAPSKRDELLKRLQGSDVGNGMEGEGIGKIADEPQYPPINGAFGENPVSDVGNELQNIDGIPVEQSPVTPFGESSLNGVIGHTDTMEHANDSKKPKRKKHVLGATATVASSDKTPKNGSGHEGHKPLNDALAHLSPTARAKLMKNLEGKEGDVTHKEFDSGVGGSAAQMSVPFDESSSNNGLDNLSSSSSIHTMTDVDGISDSQSIHANHAASNDAGSIDGLEPRSSSETGKASIRAELIDSTHKAHNGPEADHMFSSTSSSSNGGLSDDLEPSIPSGTGKASIRAELIDSTHSDHMGPNADHMSNNGALSNGLDQSISSGTGKASIRAELINPTHEEHKGPEVDELFSSKQIKPKSRKDEHTSDGSALAHLSPSQRAKVQQKLQEAEEREPEHDV